MDVATTFDDFLNNIEVKNSDNIISRFKTVTKRLNKDYYDGLEKDDEHGVYIGSFGRDTAINGVSDLDIDFIMPDEDFKKYNKSDENGQYKLLCDVKESLKKTYSTSTINVDRYVVVVKFAKDFIEVCPVFEEKDGSYTFPDSYNNGSWKKTNPNPEAAEINLFDDTTSGNLKKLCRMSRAWKDKMGVKIGGLLLDTFAYNFLKSDTKYHSYTTGSYDILVRDFFEYLKDLDDNKKYWLAPGSNQHVYKKNSNFKAKAKKAYDIVVDAIAKKDEDDVYEEWQKVFGKVFPYPQTLSERSSNYTTQEEYIEVMYPINIIYKVRIECEVTQAGFRTELLRKMTGRLRKNKKLMFYIENTDVPKPYRVLWKVKNEGIIAKQRNSLRGQIIDSNNGDDARRESSDFEGEHYVECYIIKDGFCVAKDRIDVPISTL